jgi:hypothetical protein
MFSDSDVYRAAVWLIEKHGNEALAQANRLIDLTLARRDKERLLERRDKERVLVMLRVRRAIVDLETPASRTLH